MKIALIADILYNKKREVKFMSIRTIIYRAILPAVLLSFFFMAGCGLYGPNDNSVENSTDTRLVGTWNGGPDFSVPRYGWVANDTYQFTYDGTYSDTYTPTGQRFPDDHNRYILYR